MMINAKQFMSGGVMNNENKVVADLCHIYIITKLPRFIFKPQTTRYENGRIFGHVQYRVKGEVREIEFDVEFPLLDGAVRAELSTHPHAEMHTLAASDNEICYLPANMVAFNSPVRMERSELHQLEVLYVGCSGQPNPNTALSSYSDTHS